MTKDIIERKAKEFDKEFPKDMWVSAHNSWLPIHVKAFLKQALLEAEDQTLEDYTRFLCDAGYTDSDVWSEEPTAIERFKNK